MNNLLIFLLQDDEQESELKPEAEPVLLPEQGSYVNPEIEESGGNTEPYNDDADGQNANSDLNEPVSII